MSNGEDGVHGAHEVPKEVVLSRVEGLKDAAEALWRRADRIEGSVSDELATYLREGAEALADKAYRWAEAVGEPEVARLTPAVVKGIQKRAQRTGDRGMVLMETPEGRKVMRIE